MAPVVIVVAVVMGDDNWQQNLCSQAATGIGDAHLQMSCQSSVHNENHTFRKYCGLFMFPLRSSLRHCR